MRIDWRSPRLLVVLLFAVSRLLARGVFGLRFDAATLDYWQVLDPQLLRTDLLRSVLFQHGQPPLFNLFLGVVLKAAGDHAAPAFDAVFLALGLALLATLSTTRSDRLIADGASEASALTSGYHLAFLVGAGLAAAAVLVTLTVLRPAEQAAPAHEARGGEPAWERAGS